MTPIATERLVIRNWRDGDRDLFHRINSDERVMRFFPFRRSREEADRFLDTVRAAIDERGWGFAALERTADGACIGFCGLSPAGLDGLLGTDAVEIGWRLAPEFWGQGHAGEAARAWLAFGFETLNLAEIVSFAVWNNDPSLAVMRRIGMRHDTDGDFDHPRVPESHTHLRRHRLYRITAAQWAEGKGAERKGAAV